MARRTSRDVKQYRKDVSKLKRLGLYEPKSDKLTSYGKKQVNKYSDVLTGRATVVRAKGGRVHVATDMKTREKIYKTLSAAERAKSYKGVLRVKGDKIIVQQPPASKPRFSAKTGEITIDVNNAGRIERGHVVPVKIQDIDDLRRIESEGFYFSLPLRKFGSRSIDYINYEDVDELIKDITEYYRKPDLARYVILVPKRRAA